MKKVSRKHYEGWVWLPDYREGLREPGRVGKGLGGLERFRDCYREPWSMKQAREDLRGPGRGGEGQGWVERTMERCRGSGSVIEGHGVWKGPGRI